MADQVEVFREFLRRKTLKLTDQRMMVFRRIHATRQHFSADGLVDLLKQDGTPISKATVYRTLALMLEAGLLDQHDFGQGQKLYEPMFGRPHHDHLYCLRCGRITEFQNAAIEHLQDTVSRRYDFEMLSHSLKLFGLCRSCRGKADPRALPELRSALAHAGAGRGRRTAAGPAPSTGSRTFDV